jgi:hypothetical protein
MNTVLVDSYPSGHDINRLVDSYPSGHDINRGERRNFFRINSGKLPFFH